MPCHAMRTFLHIVSISDGGSVEVAGISSQTHSVFITQANNLDFYPAINQFIM